MEEKVKTKNIFVLLFFFLLGFISHILIFNWQKIDIYELITRINKDTIVEEIAPIENEQCPVCEESSQEETIPDLCPVLVDIGGAVNTPGVYCFKKGDSVIDAVKKANGFTLDAGFKYISMKMNLATVMIDNSKIYIPFETDYDCNLLTFNLPKQVVDIVIPPVEDETEVEQEEVQEEELPQGCVSINSGTQAELETLDGVGPSTAQKIIEGRPYTVLEDLLNVSGIGEATFNKFKDSICL